MPDQITVVSRARQVSLNSSRPVILPKGEYERCRIDHGGEITTDFDHDGYCCYDWIEGPSSNLQRFYVRICLTFQFFLPYR